MYHPSIIPGAMKRAFVALCLLSLLVTVGGCSLFGIATKGDLNKLADEQDLQNQQLQAQVAESEKQLDTRLVEVEGKARQFDEDLARYENEIRAAQLELQSIKLDLDTFEADLVSATNDSKRSLQIHHSAIISERDRLRNRLNELDQLIMGWGPAPQSQPAGTATPVPGGIIVPEEPEQDASTASSDASAEDTSVWQNRGSGNN